VAIGDSDSVAIVTAITRYTPEGPRWRALVAYRLLRKLP
jgi:hypothetical protein